MDPLLADILAVPLEPDTAPRASDPRDFTSKLELNGDSLEVELTEAGANEGTALRFLESEGLTPSDWEATHFRKIEYGMGLTSVRFSYKRVGFADKRGYDLSDIMGRIEAAPPALPRPADRHGAIVALGDTQWGKRDGDGVEGTLKRCVQYLNRARDEIACSPHPVSHVHIAWLGDHIEGFVSQGGANVARTALTLNEQIRLSRRVMYHAAEIFAPLAVRVTMAAVPGNHGEAVRFAGKGQVRYDDSHDTEALVCVAEGLAYNPDAFGHVETYVPDTDELTVVLDVAGLKVAHAHGHMWRPNKAIEWWRGQAFHSPRLEQADLLLAGHLHHFHMEEDGKRTFIQVPALESESTWWRHGKGSTGNPGIVLAYVLDGRLGPVQIIR